MRRLATIGSVRVRVGVAAGALVLALAGGGARGAALAFSTVPSLRPDARLVATPALTSDFGGSVAISRNGDTAAIGGETDDGGAGAAWVFTRIGVNWVQQGPKLVAKDVGAHSGFEGRFGARVAISADGSVVLVGNTEGALSGWVFVRSGGSWRELGRRLAPRGAVAEEPSQGGVALSGDGGTVVLSGSYRDAQGIARNAAWVFVRSGDGWRRQGPRLTGRGDHSDGFGYSTALSGNGDTLLLGTAGGGYSGAAWIFRRSHGRFVQRGPRLPGSGEREFGESVALSADGTTALAGGAPAAGRRVVYVYRRAREGWVRSARLLAPSKTGGGYYGSDVALSANGRTALIAAPTLAGSGVEYLFASTGERWRQAGELTGATGLGDDVALAGDGDTVLVPPDGDDPHSTAYLYTRTAGAHWSEQTPTLMPSDESNRDSPGFGRSVALSADGGTALVGEYGGVWVFVRSGEAWIQQGPALRPPGTAGYFGSSVALSADGNTAVIGDREKRNLREPHTCSLAPGKLGHRRVRH